MHKIPRDSLHILGKSDFQGAGRQHEETGWGAVLYDEGGLVGFGDYSGEAVEVFQDGFCGRITQYGRGCAGLLTS